MREPDPNHRDPPLFWVAVILAMLAIFWAGNALMDEDPPNNEPYTGSCLEPTPQLGC